jgi:hippurate hydrolase
LPVINRIADFHEDMKTWRRHLHAHPELDFDTHETAAYVVERLKEFGVDDIETGVGRTGVVAVIKGNGGEGPTIGLRADMDALPITEVRDHAYKSTNEGVMHACGHDGHTTMLLGAARYLAETRNFKGNVALIFQPAEEGGGGGREMCADGMMDKYDISQVYALHNWPNLEAGHFATCAGPIMAAADNFDIYITGKGSHGAYPELSIDPVNVAVQIVQGLNTILSRMTDARDAAVLSVTQIHTGTASNVIPETAHINGTVRTLRHGLNDTIKEQMERIAENTAAAFGAQATLDYEYGYPITVNHGEKADFAASVAQELMGADAVNAQTKPELGAEDFSYMLEERPGAYLYLGQGASAGLHHPEYDFNDDISPIGASFFAMLVETAQPADRS